eukprot:scaffold5980_cov376-Prasinococcus_capsulatus_cf.AAC.7
MVGALGASIVQTWVQKEKSGYDKTQVAPRAHACCNVATDALLPPGRLLTSLCTCMRLPAAQAVVNTALQGGMIAANVADLVKEK